MLEMMLGTSIMKMRHDSSAEPEGAMAVVYSRKKYCIQFQIAGQLRDRIRREGDRSPESAEPGIAARPVSKL